MSGTFDTEDGEINVPPTLVSFAVDVNSYKNVITPEFKRPGSKIALFRIAKTSMTCRTTARLWTGMERYLRT